MNIPLALNTIIYIMVFLIPGILFRRAFFIGKFHAKFDIGNAFEKILWSILCSGICIILYFKFCYFVNSLKEKNEFIHLISIDSLLSNFVNLYKNEVPVVLSSKAELKLAGKSLGYLLLFSTLFGVITNRFIRILGIDRYLDFLKFSNYWDGLSESNISNNIQHKVGVIYYPKVDIKTSDGRLFTGRFKHFFYDKDSKLETLVIRDCYEFLKFDPVIDKAKIITILSSIRQNDFLYSIHRQTSAEFVCKKRILGDLFTIPNSKIENISITYVKFSSVYERFARIFKTLLSITFLLLIAFFISYAIWDYNIFPFPSSGARIMFCIAAPINFLFLIITIFTLFQETKKNNKSKKPFEIISMAFLWLSTLLPYFYIIGEIGFGGYAAIQFLSFIAINILINLLRRFSLQYKRYKRRRKLRTIM